MGELIDKAKGKVKEVAGVVSGDRKLETEGKADQVKGAAKGAFESAKQSVKNAISPKHTQKP